MSEKKEIHNTTKQYEHLKETIDTKAPLNKETIKRFFKEAELGKTIIRGSKKKIGAGRLSRIGWILVKMERDWFKKKFEEVTPQDMENFISKLENGKIKSFKGKPYTQESQLTIKKFLRKFYKWLQGNNINYPELVNWIDISHKLPEIEAIKENEVKRMLEATGNLKYKAFVMFMFDSGARIEELLNVRISDIEKPETKNFYKVRIQHSKTKPRTVSLFLPETNKYLKQYLEQHDKKDNPDAFLFDMSYSNANKIFHRLGEKALKKKVTPHMMRHSSATYYANIIKERYRFCYRYGWALSSNMPDRYIDRNGLTDEQSQDDVENFEVSKVRQENKKLETEINVLNEKIDKLAQAVMRTAKITRMLPPEKISKILLEE